MSQDAIVLSRDCPAIAIPSGLKFTMDKGTRVMLSQSLGGSHTVISHYGLARIDAHDQDALGLSPQAAAASATPVADVTETQIWDVLKTVYDPEIPVNIVDLGLIYQMTLNQEKRVDVKMTLTAPGCGMGPVIQADVRNRIALLPGVKDVNVELVWEPPWTQDRISEIGRMQLGMM